MNTPDNAVEVSKIEKRLETTRALSPQWKGAGKDGKNGNLGDFQVKTVTPSIAEFVSIANNYPEAVQEFLAGQLHIKFSGPKLVKLVKTALEAEVGRPEKGESEEWHKKYADKAKGYAAAYAENTIDFGHELRTWASEWEPEGEKTSKVEAVKNAAASALAEALGITLEAAAAMLAAKMK